MTAAVRSGAPGPRTIVLAASAAALLLAGCTTGSAGSAHVTVTTRPDSPATSTGTDVPTTGTHTGPPSPSDSPSSPPSSATSPAPPSDKPLADPCTATSLAVRLLPGGAAQGVEYAGVTITNTGAQACNVRGFPGVSLRDATGAVLVRAAPEPGATARVVRLAPGQAASAQVQDHSTCDAPLSSSVAVTAPSPAQAAAVTDTASLKQLRACSLTVAPLGPAG